MPRHRPRGPKPAPPARLTFEFRRAVPASGRKMFELTTVGGFPTISNLSRLLYADRFSLTPLVVRRLQDLAKHIYYRGNIYAEIR